MIAASHVEVVLRQFEAEYVQVLLFLFYWALRLPEVPNKQTPALLSPLASREQLPIALGLYGESSNLLFVSSNCSYLSERYLIPENYGLITACSEEQVSLGPDCQTPDVALMSANVTHHTHGL